MLTQAVDELHAAQQRQQAAMPGSGGRRGPLRRSPRERHPAVNQEVVTAGLRAARWRNRILEIDALLEPPGQRPQPSTDSQIGAPHTAGGPFTNHPGVDQGIKAEADLGLYVA